MKRSHLVLLAASCLVCVLAVAASNVANFEISRAALGLLLVLVAPGFALISAAIPKSEFSFYEYLLASVGASLAISTITAVALGAAPIGLTRLSFSITLGCCTVLLSLTATVRARIQNDSRRKDEDSSS